MKKLRNVASILVISLGMYGLNMETAVADTTSICAPALMVTNINLKTKSKQGQLAWLRLVNQSNYESSKQQASASIPEYFSGDYSSFNEKRNKLFNQESYKSSEFEAQQELSIETPSEAIAAWEKCVVENSTGLFSFAHDIDTEGATINLHWKPSAGLGQLKDVSVDIIGISPGKIQQEKTIDVGEKSFILRRASSNQVIRGVISGKPTLTSVYSAEIYIPAKISPPPVPPTPPTPPAPVKLNPLYLGQTPDCNAMIVTNHANHLGCVNTPLGYTAAPNGAAQQLLYLGIEPWKNAGAVTTKAGFRGGATQEYGWTVREESRLPNSTALYAVVGCGNNDGEVTANPHHKNCPTVPIGWTYPW